MLTKITLAFALAIAAISALPASISYAQSTPTLDCSYAYWGTSSC